MRLVEERRDCFIFEINAPTPIKVEIVTSIFIDKIPNYDQQCREAEKIAQKLEKEPWPTHIQQIKQQSSIFTTETYEICGYCVRLSWNQYEEVLKVDAPIF